MAEFFKKKKKIWGAILGFFSKNFLKKFNGLMVQWYKGFNGWLIV